MGIDENLYNPIEKINYVFGKKLVTKEGRYYIRLCYSTNKNL